MPESCADREAHIAGLETTARHRSIPRQRVCSPERHRRCPGRAPLPCVLRHRFHSPLPPRPDGTPVRPEDPPPAYVAGTAMTIAEETAAYALLPGSVEILLNIP